MRAIKTVDSEKKEKKEKRQAKRANRQSKIANRKAEKAKRKADDEWNDGLSGSCEAGNLKACKTEVKVMPKFNPNKRRISKSRLVGSKRKRDRQAKKDEKNILKQAKKDDRNILKQAKKDERSKLKDETGKTLVGRALSKVFGKKPNSKPKRRRTYAKFKDGGNITQTRKH